MILFFQEPFTLITVKQLRSHMIDFVKLNNRQFLRLWVVLPLFMVNNDETTFGCPVFDILSHG